LPKTQHVTVISEPNSC